MKPMVKKEFEGENAIYGLLEFISSLQQTMVPSCYVELLCEITKNTPVVRLIQSQSRVFVASIKSYLDKQVDIFKDKDILDHVNGEVPVMVYIITLIQKYEKTTFLPDAA